MNEPCLEQGKAQALPPGGKTQPVAWAVSPHHWVFFHSSIYTQWSNIKGSLKKAHCEQLWELNVGWYSKKWEKISGNKGVGKTKALFFHSHFQTGLCSLSYKLIRMDWVGRRDGELVHFISELVSKSELGSKGRTERTGFHTTKTIHRDQFGFSNSFPHHLLLTTPSPWLVNPPLTSTSCQISFIL